MDTGKIYAEGCVRFSETGGFLDALIEKKRLGGELLAILLSEIVARGAMPEPVQTGDRSGPAFTWPSAADVLRYRWTAS